MTIIDEIFDGLSEHINELEEQFIKNYLGDQLADENEYKLPVRAYCVLSHAAFEEYFEEICVVLVENNLHAWQEHGRVNNGLITLSIHYAQTKDPKPDFGANPRGIIRASHDLVETSLRNASSWITKYAREENHGTSISYLKKLLEPVGIEVSNNPSYLSALSNLASQRGEFAHMAVQRINRITSPDDAKLYVTDCLDLCEEVRDDANRKMM